MTFLESCDDVNAPDETGQLISTQAGFVGMDKPCLQAIIDAGGDLNLGNKHGYTALHASAAQDWMDPTFLQDLLDVGADPNVRSNDGKLPIDLVERESNYKVLKDAMTSKDED